MDTRWLDSLRTKISNMVSRGVVTRVDSSKQMQVLQAELLDTETRDNVEHVEPYGFTSVPLSGAEALVLCVGGRRDHPLAIVVADRRYRLQSLESGEVAIYDQTGSTLVFKANGDIEATPSSGLFKVNGDVEADGVSLKDHTHGKGTLTGVSGPLVSGSTGAPE